MDEMRLKLNPEKMELILFGNQTQTGKCSTQNLILDGNLIKVSQYVKYLGGGLDHNLNFQQHIGYACQKAMGNFFKICSIRQYLNREACKILTLGSCISHLDYSNAMLYGLPETTVSKLQHIQAMCAKLVLRRQRSTSTYKALKELHWLPIRQQILFKLLTIVHKCMYGLALTYLKNLIVRVPVPKRELRSNCDTTHLIVPLVKLKTFASRSFSVAGPVEWNLLPKELRCTELYELFKKGLKTHLFKQYFNRTYY